MGLVRAVFFLCDWLSKYQTVHSLPPPQKNHQFTCLGDCGLGKTTTRLTKVFTFQLVGLALCGHTDVCGDKEWSRRVRLGEEMLSHFNTLFQGKGKLAFSNTCQVWSDPGIITEPSFCSSLFSLIIFISLTINWAFSNPTLVISTTHGAKNDFKNKLKENHMVL